MTTKDNQLAILTAGASDWDTDTDANFQVLERGYHITERAGQAISSGQVLALNSGGFFKPYDPGVTSMPPVGYSFTAAASGDSMQALAWGIVRSLDVNSLGAPGKVAYSTPSGYLTTVASGLPVGIFTTGRGILFNPDHAAGSAGGGVTSIQSLTDVDPTGLAAGSILKWSNTSSKFTMQVDSAGGGGGSDVNSFWTAPASGGAGWDGRYAYGSTITSSNVIATPASSSPYNHMMGQPAKASGKRYFEFIVGNTSFAAIGVTGVGGHLKNGDGAPFGQRGVGQIGWDSGGTVKASNMPNNGTLTIGTVATYTNSVILGVAVDFDNMKLWFRVNTAGTWNNSASNDPAANTGGIDLTWAFAVSDSLLLWPGANFGSTSAHALYVRSADIGARLPSGFAAWDS